MATKMIKSVHQMFEGEKFPKPKVALVARKLPDGEPVYGCPHCSAEVTIDECDCLGAEPGCVFCAKCNGEFEM